MYEVIARYGDNFRFMGAYWDLEIAEKVAEGLPQRMEGHEVSYEIWEV